MLPPRQFFGRPLALVAAAVFFLSLLFPVVAGLSKNTSSFPRGWGVLDVALAFVLAILAFGLMAHASNKVDKQAAASYRAYRVLIHGILAMLVVFFLFGESGHLEPVFDGLRVAGLAALVQPAWFATLRAAVDR